MSTSNKSTVKMTKKYESALKKFWKGQHAVALTSFELILESDNLVPHMLDRTNSYIAACKIRLGLDAFEPKTPEDHYLIGVFHMNNGDLEDSINHLSHAVSKGNSNDAWHFSLACAYALNEENDNAIKFLTKAITINPDNQIFAINTSDFDAFRNDDTYAHIFALDNSPED